MSDNIDPVTGEPPVICPICERYVSWISGCECNEGEDNIVDQATGKGEINCDTCIDKPDYRTYECKTCRPNYSRHKPKEPSQ